MTTKAPPPGWAGVLLRVPATRTLNGPIAVSVVSCVAPVPRMAAADGEASTGTVAPKGMIPPAAVPILAAGKAGNGVPATTAA